MQECKETGQATGVVRQQTAKARSDVSLIPTIRCEVNYSFQDSTKELGKVKRQVALNNITSKTVTTTM